MADPKDAPLGSGLADEARKKIEEDKKRKKERLDAIMREMGKGHTITPNAPKNK